MLLFGKPDHDETVTEAARAAVAATSLSADSGARLHGRRRNGVSAPTHSSSHEGAEGEVLKLKHTKSLPEEGPAPALMKAAATTVCLAGLGTARIALAANLQ